MAPIEKTRICQIALSVEDLVRSREFYEQLLGMKYANTTDAFRGKTAEAVQGVPGVSSEVVWMIDDRDFMQVELFKFLTPKTRPVARTRSPWDIGYSRVAFEVNDVASFHSECSQKDIGGLSPLVAIGDASYFTMQDPTGILLEIGPAKDPLPDWLKGRPCGIALTVPDLTVALQSFHNTLGFGKLSDAPPDKGVLWGEADAEKTMVLLDGGTLWVELSQYATPASNPWPEGYRITDLGIVNVAVGFRDVAKVKDTYRRTVDAGFAPNCAPKCSPFGGCTYVNDPQGFSVEIMAITRMLDGAFGFRPANRFDRMLGRILMKLS